MTCPHGIISLPLLTGPYQVVHCDNRAVWPDWFYNMTEADPARKITNQWRCRYRCPLGACVVWALVAMLHWRGRK